MIRWIKFEQDDAMNTITVQILLWNYHSYFSHFDKYVLWKYVDTIDGFSFCKI